MTIDILFPTFNRLEFTRESFYALMANTNWNLVRYLWLVDDGSTDGTEKMMAGVLADYVRRQPVGFQYGSPAEIMKAFVGWFTRSNEPEYFAKIDSDVIVPPGWLDRCARVMQENPDLDLLGIEPPASRTPHFDGGKRSPALEIDGQVNYLGVSGGRLSTTPGCAMPKECVGYARCDSIGGIGLMRTATFRHFPDMQPHSTYGGFTEWQLQHSAITKGWICRPLDLFLLDRMPIEPFVSLSKTYEAKGWQRPWSKYPATANALWSWWTPVGSEELWRSRKA